MPYIVCMDIERLIEVAGGVAKLADGLGVRHSSVCEWKSRGSIPARRLVQIGALIGLRPEELLHLTAQVKSPE